MPVYLLNAQVTIGVNLEPTKGALLDLKEKSSTNNITATKGLMFPRVNLSESEMLYPMFEAGSAPDKYKYEGLDIDKTSEDRKHAGLIVYNLTDNCVFCPGIYAWNGTTWQRLMEACCPCILSITSGGTLHQSVNIGDNTTPLGAVTVNYNTGETSATTYQWYSNTTNKNTGGTAITGATNPTYTLPVSQTSVAGIFYFYCIVTSACDGKSMASNVYSVTVSDPCSGIAVTNKTGGNICGSGTTTLTATASSGAVIRWYNAQTGGTLLQTGTTQTDTYTTGNLSVTTTYWVEAYNATHNCTSARTAIVATVNAIPAAPTGAAGASVCINNTATLSATPPAGCTIDWYDAATSGNLVASGTNSYTTPSLSATKTYYAEARNTTSGCKSASRLAVTATVTPLPTIIATPSGTTPTANGNANVTASATPSAGANIRWFDVATGGTAIGTGNTLLVTPKCTDAINVYAEAYNNCGASARTKYTIASVQVKMHGTLKITKISSLYYEVSVTFKDNTLPSASWIRSGGNGITWQTPTINTSPNSYTCQMLVQKSGVTHWNWRLRADIGGCTILFESEPDSVSLDEIWLYPPTGSSYKIGDYYSGSNGATFTYTF